MAGKWNLYLILWVIKTSFSGLGLCRIRPCVSRIKPVHDVVGDCLGSLWPGGGRMNKGYD